MRKSKRPLVANNAADDVTVQELNNLELYAQWSFAAYCNSKRSVGDPIICNEGECDLIYTANTTIAATFESVPIVTLIYLRTSSAAANSNHSGLVSDIQGFLAIDPVANQIVLSLRGSSSIQNFVTEYVLYTKSSKASPPPDCRVFVSLGF